MIIGITGFAGSGKNTAASMINFIANGYSFENWSDTNVVRHGWPLSLLKQYRDKNYSYFGELGLTEMLIDIAGNNRKQVSEPLNVFFEEKSFASKVKDICTILTGIPREDWDNRELRNKELLIEGLNNPIVFRWHNQDSNTYFRSKGENYTYRTFMQRVGTEAMRDMIHQDIWINALMVDYKWTLGPGWVPSYNDPDNSGCHPNAEPEYPNWVIPDLRFINEAKEIKDRNGIIIRINKSSYSDDSHASEFEHLQIVPDYIVSNDATFEHLWEQMVFVLTKLNLIQ